MSEQSVPIQPPQTSPLTRMRYRVSQFVRGLLAGELDSQEAQAVSQLLPEAAVPLFAEMSPDVQRHSMNVLTTLRSAGYDDPDLAAAALLHDVGKAEAGRAGVGINLWMRGPLVMAEAIAPATLAAQARSTPDSAWRYALFVHFAHPQIGADWAQAGGCSELTCWLIAHHQDAVDDATTDLQCRRLLTALQWADGMN
jgi:hypothetical protein